MLSHQLYYTIKPYIPRRMRMAVRQLMARRTRQRHAHTWPINYAAGQAPVGWRGWPDGKKFAFVITHDVESLEGLRKCQQIAAIDKTHGFRSAFNFIPEGSYRVSPELRALLAADGFEIGVHDLKHDGKLFLSRSAFARSARRINHYLREWGASGYRSGFMLRRLDWLHDLDIDYDASTFDTDPFEPQPEGSATIFPFWISNDANENGKAPRTSRGYVELPYTLAQDSTLFLVLREKDPRIWIEKLDWIAARGGMALVNVHPDYVRFDSETSTATTFPVAHYSTLLQHVQRNYSHDVWLAAPRDVARHLARMRELTTASCVIPRAPVALPLFHNPVPIPFSKP